MHWLLALLVATTYLYKWVDEKGTLHVTDRFEDVPKKLRDAFAKQREAAEKRGQKAPPAPAAAPPANTAPGTSAYAQWQQRAALEREVRAESQKRRAAIGDARAAISALEEERGNLAANPLLNIAQPARVERMSEIDNEVAVKQRAIDTELNSLRERLEQGVPEDWVTGL